MSVEVEFDDIGRAVLRRVVIVIDFPLLPPTLLVHRVSLIEGSSTEVRWLPVTDERIYLRWHMVWKGKQQGKNISLCSVVRAKGKLREVYGCCSAADDFHRA
jgi:hypothetical protein